MADQTAAETTYHSPAPIPRAATLVATAVTLIGFLAFHAGMITAPPAAPSRDVRGRYGAFYRFPLVIRTRAASRGT